MWSAEAEAEGLTLVRVAENKTGYFGVHHNHPGQPKPYQARVQSCPDACPVLSHSSTSPSRFREK